MSKNSIEREITIATSAANVWRIFTDPAVTRSLGGEYVSEWAVGGSLNWKDLNGTIHTSGTILAMEKEKLLKHELTDHGTPLSIITYELVDNNGTTLLKTKEELNYTISGNQLREAEEGWDLALKSVKETAEKL
jgi:uncharacterized protein YndB with AHSA1/START domain